jgi:hypothetical protein
MRLYDRKKKLVYKMKKSIKKSTSNTKKSKKAKKPKKTKKSKTKTKNLKKWNNVLIKKVYTNKKIKKGGSFLTGVPDALGQKSQSVSNLGGKPYSYATGEMTFFKPYESNPVLSGTTLNISNI